MASDTKAKAARNPVFFAIGAFCFALGVYAFWPYITGLAAFPGLVHLHAAVMAGWMLLFVCQVYFAYRGAIGQHIMCGNAARWFTIPVFVMGIAMGYHKVARVAKAGGRVDSARVHFMGSFVHFIQFAACFFAGYLTRSKKDLHRVFMVYANAALLPPAGGRLIINHGWSPGAAIGCLPFGTMVAALLYECAKGTRRSVGLSLSLALFIVIGLVVEMEGSQTTWFAAFTERALAWDLMPHLGDTTYGDINEPLP
jgi:hypothetical protein